VNRLPSVVHNSGVAFHDDFVNGHSVIRESGEHRLVPFPICIFADGIWQWYSMKHNIVREVRVNCIEIPLADIILHLG